MTTRIAPHNLHSPAPNAQPSARQRITLWKKEQLCSDYCIRFWSSVVASGDSATFKAKVLDASQRRSTGMMQNTPFSFLMREQR